MPVQSLGLLSPFWQIEAPKLFAIVPMTCPFCFWGKKNISSLRLPEHGIHHSLIHCKRCRNLQGVFLLRLCLHVFEGEPELSNHQSLDKLQGNTCMMTVCPEMPWLGVWKILSSAYCTPYKYFCCCLAAPSHHPSLHSKTKCWVVFASSGLVDCFPMAAAVRLDKEQLGEQFVQELTSQEWKARHYGARGLQLGYVDQRLLPVQFFFVNCSIHFAIRGFVVNLRSVLLSTTASVL